MRVLLKDASCPEFLEGDELYPIEHIFRIWITAPEEAHRVWRTHNCSRFSGREVQRWMNRNAWLSFDKVLTLRKFIAEFSNLYGADHIITSVSDEKYVDARRTFILNDHKRRLFSHTKKFGSSDDQRNGTFYKERQLQFIGIK